MSELLFIGQQPLPEQRIIRLQQGPKYRLWFRWNGDWVREEWCGRFSDGTIRPPWHDEEFMRLWSGEGPEAANDKSRYDLSDLEAMLAVASKGETT